MNDAIIIITCAVAGILIIGFEIFRYVSLKRFMGNQKTTQRRLQQDMHALCAGGINLGKHVDILEKRIRRLVERQDQLELRDPLEQTYAHAIRLAQKGVNVNELVESCGLARGEAELLLRIHHAQRQEASNA